MDIIKKLNKIGFHDGDPLYINLDFEKSRVVMRFQSYEIDYKKPEYNEARIMFEQVSNFAIWSPNGENMISEMWDITILSGVFWIENNIPKAKIDIISGDSKYYIVLAFSFQDASIEFSINESCAN